jgi:CRP/FNR family transcriptional regulator, cyclic AMP receptor protein
MSSRAAVKKPAAIDRRAALATFDILRGLSAAELDALVAQCTWRPYEKGREVIEQEGGSKDVYFVASGRVRITIYAASGREVSFRDLAPGASFGELSAVDGLSRSASVVALEDTWVASISRDQFWTLLRTKPAVTENVVKVLVALVRNLTERVVDYSTLGVRNRIQAELVRMARETKPSGNRCVIAPAPKHLDIANRVSTNREEVAREFSHLSREKVIERRQGELVILDLRRLVSMVERVREV